MVSRVLALVLVALAVSPFTAPFSSCDLGDLVHRTPMRVRSQTVAGSISLHDVTVDDLSVPEAPADRALTDVRPEHANRSDAHALLAASPFRDADSDALANRFQASDHPSLDGPVQRITVLRL